MVTIEDVQDCMNVSIGKPRVVMSFENVIRDEEVEPEQ